MFLKKKEICIYFIYLFIFKVYFYRSIEYVKKKKNTHRHTWTFFPKIILKVFSRFVLFCFFCFLMSHTKIFPECSGAHSGIKVSQNDFRLFGLFFGSDSGVVGQRWKVTEYPIRDVRTGKRLCRGVLNWLELMIRILQTKKLRWFKKTNKSKMFLNPSVWSVFFLLALLGIKKPHTNPKAISAQPT